MEMENKNEQKFRKEFDSERLKEDAFKASREASDDGDELAAREFWEFGTAIGDSSAGSDKRVFDEIGERYRERKEEREKLQKYRAIEETEVSEDATTTKLYRRAVAEFDPDETRPQLAEFYRFRDREIDEHGFF